MIEHIAIGNNDGIVEFEDAAEFFTHRANIRCPVCGHNKWNVYASDSDGKSRFTTGLTGVSLPSRKTMGFATAVVTATCEKCAFIRIHNAEDIRQWVIDGKPEFKDAE